MMAHLRPRRPLSTDRTAADILNGNIIRPPPIPTGAQASPPGQANVNYVLQRYGGLNVFVPNFSISALARGVGMGAGRLRQPPLTRSRSEDPAEGEGSSSDSVDFVRRLNDCTDGPPPPIIDPYGKFTPLFGGRLVLGSGKWLFLGTLLLLAAYIVNTVFMKVSIQSYCGGLHVYLCGIALGVLTLVTFVILGITDPGVVPKNYTLTELLAETEEYRANFPQERYFRYCNKCKTSRPPRTFHCSSCEICVRQQDTHLWAAGICIGERNRRSYFFHVLFQTMFGAYLLSTSLIIAPHIVRGSVGYTRDIIQIIGSTVTGMALLLFPQCGIFMLIYKLYLIGVGRTAREEYRKYHCYDTNDCVMERLPICVNIRNFFCLRSMQSAFRRTLNRVDPESALVGMPDAWILEQTLPRRRPRIQMRDSRELIQIQNFVEPETDEQDIANRNVVARNATGGIGIANENVRLREVASHARGKLTSSVPLFEHSLTPAMTRIKMPRRSRPSLVLQQQISAFHNASKVPKATVSNHKRQKLPVSLSDGCIPRTKDGLPEMIQLSRATQLRRIIQMILLRDRDGLIEMSNRVNIAALVGMNRFDPDNLQLLELNNGLPMIAPRRREADAGNHRLGAGVLGIPQMVAAGLLPTARDIANSVETMVGRGRVRRLPPVGRQRYTPITLMGNSQAGTVGLRRILNGEPLPNRVGAQSQNAPQNPLLSPPLPTHPPNQLANFQRILQPSLRNNDPSSRDFPIASLVPALPSPGPPIAVQPPQTTNLVDVTGLDHDNNNDNDNNNNDNNIIIDEGQ